MACVSRCSDRWMKSVINSVAMLAAPCQLKDSRSSVTHNAVQTTTAATDQGRDSHAPALVRKRLMFARMSGKQNELGNGSAVPCRRNEQRYWKRWSDNCLHIPDVNFALGFKACGQSQFSSLLW